MPCRVLCLYRIDSQWLPIRERRYACHTRPLDSQPELMQDIFWCCQDPLKEIGASHEGLDRSFILSGFETASTGAFLTEKWILKLLNRPLSFFSVCQV
jgi:hypothetical protein